MEKTDNKELSNLLPAFLAVVITSFIIGGFFFWQKQSLDKMREELRKELVRKEEPTITPRPTVTPATLSATLSPSFLTITPTPTSSYEGWLTYTNDIYHYQFKYPPGATIEEATKEAFSLAPDEVSSGMTFEEKFSRYTGKICVTVFYNLGYVQISAPPNSGFAHVICGRTGRAYEGPSKSEVLTIEGRSYTASGFEEQGPGETLNLHNETMVVTLEDGTRIEYGSRPSDSATFADYLTIRDEIIKILESFKKI